MRLPKLTELSPASRRSVTGQRRRGGTRGPFLVWLRSPELAEKSRRSAVLPVESSLDLRLSELSLLVAARFRDAQYSWNAHVTKAIDAGVSQEALKRWRTWRSRPSPGRRAGAVPVQQGAPAGSLRQRRDVRRRAGGVRRQGLVD